MVVVRGKKIGTLFVNSSCRSIITVVENIVSSNLWHYRLGHMSEKGMKVLHSDGKLHGLKEVNYAYMKGVSLISKKGLAFLSWGDNQGPGPRS